MSAARLLRMAEMLVLSGFPFVWAGIGFSVFGANYNTFLIFFVLAMAAFSVGSAVILGIQIWLFMSRSR